MRTLDEILTEYPKLTMCGWGTGESGDTTRPREEVVVAVAKTLDGMTKAARFSQHGSYLMKHIAEAAIGRYVSNGEFIAAALMQGFRIKTYPGSINVDLNFTNADVKRYNQKAGNPRILC